MAVPKRKNRSQLGGKSDAWMTVFMMNKKTDETKKEKGETERGREG